MGKSRGSLSARSFRLLSQLSNPSQVSSSAGRSAAASSSSSLETSGVSGTAATAGTPTRRPRAGSRTGSGPVDAVSPRRLLLVELRPVVKRGGCRCDTSRASSARRRTDCGMPPEESRGRLRSVASLASETSLGPVGYSKRYSNNVISGYFAAAGLVFHAKLELVCLLVPYRPLAQLSG